MYKILIVEDETLEREALKRIITENFAHIMDVFDADNGDDALALAVQQRPDIILMDIHLGSSNGIDLAKLILEDVCMSRIIISTAFDQFSYAQSALKIGVKDFLLKPIKTNELVQSINAQLMDIQRAEAELKAIDKSGEAYKKWRPFLEKQLFSMASENSYNQKEIESIFEALGITFYSCCIFVAEVLNTYGLDFSQQVTAKKKAGDLLKEELTDYRAIFGDQSIMQISFIVFFEKPKEDFQLRLESIEFSKSIRGVVAEKLACEIRVGISEPVMDTMSIGSAYYNALFALRNGAEAINSYPDMAFRELKQVYPRNIEANILRGLFSREPFDVENELSAFTASFQANDALFSKSAFLQLIANIYKEINEKFGDALTRAQELIVQSISDIAKEDRLKNQIKLATNLLTELQIMVIEKRNTKNVYFIERAEKYISENYASGITLEKISERLRISPYYLCRMFKSVRGVNMLDYITNVRLEKAKEYMKDANVSVKEISVNLGFSDPNYFCKVFKRVTGMTPSEYRAYIRKNT